MRSHLADKMWVMRFWTVVLCLASVTHRHGGWCCKVGLSLHVKSYTIIMANVVFMEIISVSNSVSMDARTVCFTYTKNADLYRLFLSAPSPPLPPSPHPWDLHVVVTILCVRPYFWNCSCRGSLFLYTRLKYDHLQRVAFQVCLLFIYLFIYLFYYEGSSWLIIRQRQRKSSYSD